VRVHQGAATTTPKPPESLGFDIEFKGFDIEFKGIDIEFKSSEAF